MDKGTSMYTCTDGITVDSSSRLAESGYDHARPDGSDSRGEYRGHRPAAGAAARANQGTAIPWPDQGQLPLACGHARAPTR